MLEELLEGNAKHVASLAPDHFDGLEDGQDPPVVAVCCADSRVSAEGMWSLDRPGQVFLSETIGNQVWDAVDGELEVSGDVAYPLEALDPQAIAVVGHTGCGAIQAALTAVQDGDLPKAPGLRQKVQRLIPVVEAGLEQDQIAQAEDPLDLLVEVNVHAQVDVLRSSDLVPSTVEVLGFVYDLHGRYGGPPGRAYLIDRDGQQDPEALADGLPGHLRSHVGRLLDV